MIDPSRDVRDHYNAAHPLDRIKSTLGTFVPEDQKSAPSPSYGHSLGLVRGQSFREIGCQSGSQHPREPPRHAFRHSHNRAKRSAIPMVPGKSVVNNRTTHAKEEVMEQAEAKVEVMEQPKNQTTGVLVLLTAKQGVTREQVMKIMPVEIRATVRLYLEGRIRDWYARADGTGAVFLLDCKDVAEAEAIIERLPLSAEHLLDHQYIAVGPLAPLGLLMGGPAVCPA